MTQIGKQNGVDFRQTAMLWVSFGTGSVGLILYGLSLAVYLVQKNKKDNFDEE